MTDSLSAEVESILSTGAGAKARAAGVESAAQYVTAQLTRGIAFSISSHAEANAVRTDTYAQVLAVLTAKEGTTMPELTPTPAVDAAQIDLMLNMKIPAFENIQLGTLLTVIRGAIVARVEASESMESPVTEGKKYRDAAVKAFSKAYFLPVLTEKQAEMLMVATGLRHAQVCGLTREESQNITATLGTWFPRATKASKTAQNTLAQREAKGLVQDMSITVFQELRAQGGKQGDRFIITLGNKTDALTIDRAGKKAYGLYDSVKGELSHATAVQHRDVASQSMLLGRARRIARELQGNGAAWDKLNKGDTTWLGKGDNRANVEQQLARLLKS